MTADFYATEVLEKTAVLAMQLKGELCHQPREPKVEEHFPVGRNFCSSPPGRPRTSPRDLSRLRGERDVTRQRSGTIPPIESLWSIIKEELSKKPSVRSEKTLFEDARTSWQSIDGEISTTRQVPCRSAYGSVGNVLAKQS